MIKINDYDDDKHETSYDEKESDYKKSQSFINYNNRCDFLKMLAIPYVGVYSSDLYLFMNIESVFLKHSLTHLDKRNFPQKLNDYLFNIENKYQNLPVDYFNIVYNSDILYENYFPQNKDDKNAYLRMNLALHPYIFYNINGIEKEHKTYTIPALFKSNDKDGIIMCDDKEKDRLIIDPTYYDFENHKRELLLHDTNGGVPGLSPNNCGFLVSLYENNLLVYFTCLVLYGGKVIKLMVAQ